MEQLHKHLLTGFETALDQLRNDVAMMSSLTQRNFGNALKGLFERNDDLCNLVIAEDESIDQLEKQVDSEGVSLLTRFQPVASDLRQVVSAMKVSSNLERVADQAVNIARKARKLNQHPPLTEVSWLEPMCRQASELFADSIKTYMEGDVALAGSLKARDKQLDALDAQIASRLTDSMTQNPSRIADFLSLIFISRHLERVGDHATNIAEDTVYAVAAEDIRHTQGSAPK